MQDRWGRGIAAFAAFQVGDAIACAKLDYIRNDLDRINCPPRVQRVLPFIKAGSALGLLLGRRWPRVGRLTAAALSAYFACAVGFHVRAKDPAWRSLPAASLLALSFAVALRGYEEDRATDPNGLSPAGEAVAELTTATADVIDRQPKPAESTV